MFFMLAFLIFCVACHAKCAFYLLGSVNTMRNPNNLVYNNNMNDGRRTCDHLLIIDFFINKVTSVYN